MDTFISLFKIKTADIYGVSKISEKRRFWNDFFFYIVKIFEKLTDSSHNLNNIVGFLQKM